MARELTATPGPDDGRIRTLDPHEFARLFEQSSGVLWTLAAGVVGDRSQADDVLQEAAVIALGKLEQFQPGTSFLAWMGQVVRFVALNQARKRVPGNPMDPDLLDELWDSAPMIARPPDESGRDALTELAPDQDHFDDQVVAALRMLSPVARACLLLRSVHGLEYRELSMALGIPEGTAMSHVHRARATLRSLLRSRGGVESSRRGLR